jgi:hypothetical protein
MATMRPCESPDFPKRNSSVVRALHVNVNCDAVPLPNFRWRGDGITFSGRLVITRHALTVVASLRRPEAIEHGLKRVKAIAVFMRPELGAWQKRETWFASDRHVCDEEQDRILPAVLALSAGRQQ